MQEEITYMLGVIAVGFIVNYALRALPFLLFAGRGRELPGWVGRFGAFVSPVIIACLIVYSYSGLAWRTPWPYLAGAVTVGVHLWRRNPLASIVAGTVLYMCLVTTGCRTVSDTLDYDIDHPLVRISSNGMLFRDKYVTPAEVAPLLERHRVPKDATVYVLVDDDYDDQHALWVFKHNYLNRAGYTRSAYVHRRRAESGTTYRLDPSSRQTVTPYERRVLRNRAPRATAE